MDVRLTFSFAIIRDKADKIIPHSHNCHEMVFYDTSSNGIASFGDEYYRFSAGGIALIRNGSLHDEKHYNGGRVVCVGFETDEALENLYVTGMNKLRYIFDQILEEVHEQKFGYEEVVSCKIKEILINVTRKIKIGHGEIKTLAHCRQYIKENFSQNIKIADVAAIIGYSPDHFRHLFKKTYGISPQGYLMEKRLNFAYGAFISTKSSFAQIAENCGFSNLSQMTRMIKKRYGKTPTRIRNDN